MRCWSDWTESPPCDPAGASSSAASPRRAAHGAERSCSASKTQAPTCSSAHSATPTSGPSSPSAGGSQAGLGNSIACRLPPTTDVEADELIDACAQVATQLDHYPGGQPLDRDGLRELILRFALLLDSVPEAIEADLNSIRCTSDSCSVLDMRMRLERRARLERVKTW